MMINHALMYLTCMYMVIGVRELRRKKSARQYINEMCTTAR